MDVSKSAPFNAAAASDEDLRVIVRSTRRDGAFAAQLVAAEAELARRAARKPA